MKAGMKISDQITKAIQARTSPHSVPDQKDMTMQKKQQQKKKHLDGPVVF